MFENVIDETTEGVRDRDFVRLVFNSYHAHCAKPQIPPCMVVLEII